MICSDANRSASAADEPLLSPPRDWPACFKAAPLSNFTGKRRLKGTRCRLTSTPPPVATAAAASVSLQADDSAGNSARLNGALGWPVVRGFAVFELERAPGTFVAVPRAWNVLDGLWVDLTPRPPGQEQQVLLESELAQTLGAVASAEHAAPRPPQPRPPPLTAEQRQSREAQRMQGMWKVYRGVRNGRIRMRIDAESARFALEAECWHKRFAEEEYADDIFDPVDSDDTDAAQCRATGTWRAKDRLLTLHFETVEQVGPGRRLPLKAAEIYAVVGTELGKCMFCSVEGLAFSMVVGGGNHSTEGAPDDSSGRGGGRTLVFEAQ